ncbi:MAG: aldo/keto reductase [Clostridia bacterium]|nr:aldo/keto reductase [Clostridia bacterium]
MIKISDHRYDHMIYNRLGNSGLKLPAVSLGLWQNFGSAYDFDNVENMCYTAFNAGITHFDLANNYGHPYNGSAETNFGKVLKGGLGEYRDELVISTKAGYEMWPGPYGDRNGSRKYLIASLDQSLRRMGLDYVDIFYHHVYDPHTPLEETAHALDQIVRQGKALYVGISNYKRETTAKMQSILKELGTPFVVNQPSYSMLNRWIEEDGLKDYARDNGLGLAVFSPLSRGALSSKYLGGVTDEMIALGKGKNITPNIVAKLNMLNDIAISRGQTLSQMALSWILRDGVVTTVLTGASTPEQILQNVGAISNLEWDKDTLEKIELILK